MPAVEAEVMDDVPCGSAICNIEVTLNLTHEFYDHTPPVSFRALLAASSAGTRVAPSQRFRLCSKGPSRGFGSFSLQMRTMISRNSSKSSSALVSALLLRRRQRPQGLRRGV